MKFTAKLLLVILFIPIFVATLVAASIKYQLLAPNFWKDSMSGASVYKDLSSVIRTSFETKTVTGGGTKNDVKILTDIASPDNVRDFMERNVDNILNFANGKSEVLLVYLPISKIPKELAPKSDALNSEVIPATALLAKFNIDQSFLPNSQISYAGRSANYLLIITLTLSALVLISLFALTEHGGKFVGPGVAFVSSGAITILIVNVLNMARLNAPKDLIKSSSFANKIVNIIAPVILEDVFKIWLVVGIASVAVGIVLFFLKRPKSSK